MEIALVITSIASASFLILYLSLLSKFKSVSKGFTQLFVAYNSLAESVNNSANDSENIHRESFIKFLSDSRDWAFNYIEDVHSELDSFIKDLEYDMDYFERFGILTEQYPHYEVMQKLSAHYKKIKNLLPENNDDRR